jgi:hypothetical protein
MTTEIIDVAAQFSPYPFGRYPEHGPFNGQRFRDEFLLPALRRGARVVVDLTRARGVAPSFLEEAFGGLIRAGLPIESVNRNLIVRSDVDASLAVEVHDYILAADEQLKGR